MAGTISPGDAIDAIHSILTSDLPAKLDALDTEYSSTGDEVLADLVKIWKSPIERFQENPGASLVSSGFARLEEVGHNIYDVFVTLVVNLSHGNVSTGSLSPAELLTQQIQRTIRGAAEVILSKRTLSVSSVNNADFVYLDEVRLGFVPGENTLTQRAEMDFRVRVSV